MPTARRLSVLLAVAAAWTFASTARAEVIDYNPVTTEPPQILSPAELARYDALVRGVSVPALTTSGVLPGKHALVRVGSAYKVLDTSTGQMGDLTLGNVTAFGTLFWLSPTTAAAYGNVNGQQPAKVIFDFAAGSVTGTPFSLPTLAGKQINVVGRLIQTADKKLHVLAFTNTTGSQLKVVAPPSFDQRSQAEREALGQAEPPAIMAPNPEQILAISVDDGQVTPLGTVPAGYNVGGAANSVNLRPGTNTAAYVLGQEIPWTGEVRGNRANRGGFMPPSYFNTRENLGLVPEAENRWITNRRLVLVDMATGDELRVIENKDHPGGMFSGTLWTADGQHLVVRTIIPSILQGRANPIYEYSAGVKLRLFTPDGSFEREWRRAGMDGSISFAPVVGSVVYALNAENMTRSAYLVDLAEPERNPVKVYDGSDQAYLYNLALAGDKVVAIRASVGDPGDLYLGDTGKPNSQLTRLTDGNAALRQVSNIKYEPITYQTSSGFTVTGVYAYPGDMSYPPSKPMPVVVWQEGGPGGQMVNRWGASVESPYSLLPNFGIPVFMVNGAGRTSNGAAFYSAMADGRNYGTRDIMDVKEGVDYLVQQGIADPKAIGVTGCSYGGYFTLQSITQLPGYYAAGNAQCSLNDVMWEFNFGWSPFLAYLVGTTTTADPAEYVHDSPTYNAWRNKTPLLLFHGTDDFLPFEHITNIHDQVAAGGTPARFLRAYKRGHGFGQVPSDPQGVPAGARTQKYAFQLQLQWFREHLGIRQQPRFSLTLPGLTPGPVTPIHPIGPGPLR